MSRRNRRSKSRSRSSSSRSRSSISRSSSSNSQRDRDYRDHHKNKEERNHRYERRHSPPPRRRRSRSRSPAVPFSRRRSPNETKASNKIILTSLPNYADKDVLNILLARQGYHPVDIRVVRRNTDGGSVRVFGFIEFSEISTAESWVNFNQGYLRMDDGFQVRLEYSREESTKERQPYNPLTSDWTCAKCTINNFNRRTNCFKCGCSRQESDAMEAKGYGMVGVSPSDTLLIRELPSTVTEEIIRESISKYTNLIIQRVQIASSKLYAYVQMRSLEEAGYILQTFNKIIPYIDNCAVIITYSRQSLNQILIMENVNVLKSQSGISSASIHEDPTNSAAQLAQNAIRIAQMGRAQPGTTIPFAHIEGPARQSVSTPFGYLPTYDSPDPNSFHFDQSSGYYYDQSTTFYYDAKTGYYYNSNTNNWMFYSEKYSTYIDCQGGDLEMKRKLQEEERQAKQLSQSAIISAPPCSSQHQNDEITKEQQLELDAKALSTSMETKDDYQNEAPEKKKKKRKQDEEDKQKTPQEIQKEMMKWARRQEKIKMSFKSDESQQNESITTATPIGTASGRRDSKSGTAKKEPSQLEPFLKKPWDDEEEEDAGGQGELPPADAMMPGRMRLLTNRQARVRQARADLLLLNQSGDGGGGDQPNQKDHQPTHSADPNGCVQNDGGGGGDKDKSQPKFDEQKYIDRTKKSCLLCRRQFPNVEMLDKHIQMSNLHKTNLAAKLKEIQGNQREEKESDQSQQIQYRDRAKERRDHFGYDPGLNKKSDIDSGGDIESSKAVAAAKAATPLDESNVGNRLLKSMGWSEGRGLGRNLQGIVNPIQAEQHVQGVGLGSSGSKIDVNSTWKERNKKSAIERWGTIQRNEPPNKEE